MKQLKKQRKKRKTKKGFTLVELLAVIVILAIVVGITLVTVLPTLKSARQEAFELTAETAANFLEKQYQLSLIGEFSSSGLVMDEIPMLTETGFEEDNLKKEYLIAAGLKPENYVYGAWYINPETGRACVMLAASTNQTKAEGTKTLAGTVVAGEYYDIEGQVDSAGCNS